MKLDKQVTENSVTTTTDYVGPMVYEGADDVFLNTEEGWVVLKEGGTAKEEYQYTLKDHLGNVRVTFTTASSQQMSSMYLATMEPQVSSLEDSTFNNLETTRQTDKIYNHTPGGNSSTRLNASEGKVMGPSMGLHCLSRTCSGMMPGDTVKMEVYAKYLEKPKTKNVVANMASIVGAAFGVTEAGEAPQVANAVKEALATGQAGLFAKDETIPKAYLNYLFFDKDMKYKSGGFQQVTEGALGKFEDLKLDYVPQEEGYMMVYTANQANEDLNVYFDDMAVTHISGPIIRTDDYYPFGMTFNTSVLDGALANRYLYNGKEKQELTDWYDYGARMYDAELGRWGIQDPKANKYVSVSPYNYALNNPIIFVDPDGREIIGATKEDAKNFRADVYKVLADKKFDNIRVLIDTKGTTFKHIDAGALSNALDGVDLTTDEKAYVDVVTNTINSKEKQVVEYLSYGDDASAEGATAVKDYFTSQGLPAPLTPEGDLKAATISVFGGEGFNVPTKDGSHSFIISGVPNGKNTERAVTSGHEVLGHGIPSSRKESSAANNSNAIRMDNLGRRLLGLNQRNGSDHAGYQQGQITDPYKLPYTQ